MDYCLIEKWGPSNTLPDNCKAVALSEEAMICLERCGISYVTLEDFYTSYEVRGDTDAFLIDQLSWFDDFDRILKEAFPEAGNLGVNLATIYYFTIKYTVDNIILSTRILRKFIESVSPGKILFVGPKYSEGEIDRLFSGNQTSGHPFDRMLDNTFSVGESTYSLLIEPLCKDLGVDFQHLVFNTPSMPKAGFSLLRYFRTFIDPGRVKRLAKRFLPISGIQSLYVYMRSIQIETIKGRILVLQDLRSTVDLLIDARKHGFEIFFNERDGVKKISWQPWQKHIDIDCFKSSAQCIREDIFNRILNGNLMHWINRYCGLDVSGVLDSRFKYFFYKICPELLKRILDYKQFYIRNNIDFVVAPNIWTLDEHAAIAAARLTPSTKSVGFAHGSDAYECKSRFFYVNRQYDLFFSPSSSEAEHERWLGKLFNYKYPEVHEFSYLYRKLSQKHRENQRIKSLSFAGKRRVVLFVPIIYGSRPGRSVQLNQPFPMEFAKWHRALADLFSKRKDTFFIWKGLIQQGQSFDMMAGIIREKGYENIRFESSRFTRWFPYVERVICDIPSTAFFQCIYSYLPVVAIYRPLYQLLRKNAYDGFGSSLRAGNSIDECLGIVEEFLDGQREKYIVPFSEPDVFVPEILESHLYTQ